MDIELTNKEKCRVLQKGIDSYLWEMLGHMDVAVPKAGPNGTLCTNVEQWPERSGHPQIKISILLDPLMPNNVKKMGGIALRLKKWLEGQDSFLEVDPITSGSNPVGAVEIDINGKIDEVYEGAINHSNADDKNRFLLARQEVLDERLTKPDDAAVSEIVYHKGRPKQDDVRTVRIRDPQSK